MTKLTAQPRPDKKPAALRKEGLLPAVIYGRKEKSTPIAISVRDFQKAFSAAGESGIIELGGLGDEKDVLVHEVEFDPLTGTPTHADFYAIEKGQKVTVSIPFEFEGVSPAVEQKGGVLVKVMHELEVTGEPKLLPHKITIDLSKLVELHDRITIGDIKLPESVTTEVSLEDSIVMADEAKEEPVEEVAPMDISEIGTSVERGKKEEEGAEGGEAPAAAAPKAEKKKE